MTLLEALDDPLLFGSAFAGPTWRAWRVFLAALFGLELDPAALEVYRQHTGREAPPTTPASEAFAIVGRRGGKSRIAALVAVYLACFRTYALAPGERGVVMVIAGDRRQARVIVRYVVALLEGVPMLERLIAKRTAESIELRNGISIEVHTASFRSTRGYTVVAAILDELAFWRTDDAAEPDHEIVAALRPGMATVPGALLLGISSPYARRGVLWQAHRDHFGKEDASVLVWQAPTSAMNPTVPESVIRRAFEDDPASAAAEYGAEFRADVESFVAREAVEACVVPGRFELPALPELRYRAFCDPSGGSADSMTLAIGHLLAAARERGAEAHAFVLTLLDAGLRKGEARALRWRAIAWGADAGDTRRHLLVRGSRSRGASEDGHTKSGRTRKVALSRRLRGALEALYLEQRPATLDALVFPSLDEKALRSLWPALLAAASVPGLMMKDLRDTYGSWLLTLGIPIQYMSRQLGHGSIAVTETHYAEYLGRGGDGSQYVEPPKLGPSEVPADLLARLTDCSQSAHTGDPYALPDSLKSSELN